MKVKLLHSTPLWVCSTAIRKCWASEDKSDTFPDYVIDGKVIGIGEKDKALIDRVGNKNKHSSTLEHLVYNFDIDGKSTRYTLKELKEKDYTELYSFMEYLVDTGDDFINNQNCERLMGMCDIMYNIPTTNDKLKYMLPEAYKTSLVWTINARALQNFLSLRTDKSALWEIQDLAREIFKQLPEDHKYLFTDYVKEK
jgi:thymidylate synthase (FAD)